MDDLSGRRPEAALAAGVVSEALNLALGERGSVHVKPGRDVVTDADVAVEDLIRTRLKRTMPSRSSGRSVAATQRARRTGSSIPSAGRGTLPPAYRCGA
jgi:hypothetical protein